VDATHYGPKILNFSSNKRNDLIDGLATGKRRREKKKKGKEGRDTTGTRITGAGDTPCLQGFLTYGGERPPSPVGIRRKKKKKKRGREREKRKAVEGERQR